ncbi:dihydroorotate dehydrogenase (quinone) [Candidatus Woesearchaeota archaeon]|nr:dihydroorotate dehydrogenase (quinone) [Candidatus Woesearchaeota archaeon]
MGAGYRWFGRPLLRFQDSEKAHARSLSLLRLFSANPISRSVLSFLYKPRRRLPVELFGQTYIHPFGLAAGMDKNAKALRGWEATGLAFIEIGGVTMLEQSGNPKPRMFRAAHAQALVNRMGFNNNGSEKIQAALEKHVAKHGRPSVPIWVNLGKSKITPLEDAPADYATTMERLWSYGDVFVINVSSPNTPNLRELQGDEGLTAILSACHHVNERCAEEHRQTKRPVLVKVAPDMTDEQLVHIATTAKSNGADGIVVSNTTVERPENASSRDEAVFSQQGGLSGQPLKDRSTAMIQTVRRAVGGDWPIIGVGGIASADDAWQKLTAGATLIQAYSGFVFEGPALTKSIVNGLHKRLEASPYTAIADVVGSGAE